MVPIPGSNLILVVFDALECPVARMPSATYEKISIVPIEEPYNNESLPCYRRNSRLSRRRPLYCINHHVNVSQSFVHILFFYPNNKCLLILFLGESHRSVRSRVLYNDEYNVNSFSCNHSNITLAEAILLNNCRAITKQNISHVLCFYS